jgi:membrane-anchored glycerophosphoryl diester phosphodiesterase (GDPDase)
MDPGIGKAAGNFMEVMKSQPLSLALVVMNFALIGFVYFQSAQFNNQRVDNIKLFIQVQSEVQKLLSQCIIPPPVQRGDLDLKLPTSETLPP